LGECDGGEGYEQEQVGGYVAHSWERIHPGGEIR
jgi:hypothetical protein